LDNGIIDAGLDRKVTQDDLNRLLNVGRIGGADAPNRDRFAIFNDSKPTEGAELGREQRSSFTRGILPECFCKDTREPIYAGVFGDATLNADRDAKAFCTGDGHSGVCGSGKGWVRKVIL
jgi:hypothetical protein